MTDNIILNKMFKGYKIPRTLSYSRLSDFDRNGPKALIKRSAPHSYGLTLGSLIDDLAIPEEGFEFEDKYIISDYEKPTSTSGKLVDIVLENYTELPNTKELKEICRKNNFWKRSKDDTLEKYVTNPDLIGYLKDHIQSSTKMIVSSQQHIQAKEISHIIQSHPNSSYIFDESKTRLYQYKLDFEYNGIKFRGYADIVLIDHKNKTIEIVDLKTGKGDLEQFKNSFIKFRYYFQSFLYQEAASTILKEYGFNDYTIKPFKFLYVGRYQKIPFSFEVTNKWQYASKHGFILNGYKYRGADELLEEIVWHFDNGIYDSSRYAYENGGLKALDDDIIQLFDEESGSKQV